MIVAKTKQKAASRERAAVAARSVENSERLSAPAFPAPDADQFRTLQVVVKKPSRLCAPVDKNGVDPTAPDHLDHLICYQR